MSERASGVSFLALDEWPCECGCSRNVLCESVGLTSQGAIGLLHVALMTLPLPRTVSHRHCRTLSHFPNALARVHRAKALRSRNSSTRTAMTCCKKDDTVVALDGYAAGYLVKRGERIKTWKRRYFVFQHGCLTYRKDSREHSKALRSELIVDVSYYEGKKHGLCVRLMSGRALYLSAGSEEQATIWYEVFEEFLMQQQKWRELDYVHGKRNTHLAPIVESDCDYDSDRNTFTM